MPQNFASEEFENRARLSCKVVKLWLDGISFQPWELQIPGGKVFYHIVSWLKISHFRESIHVISIG